MKVLGLALGFALSYTVGLWLSRRVLSRRIGSLRDATTRRTYWRILGASLAAAVLAGSVQIGLLLLLGGGRVQILVVTIVAGILYVGTYVIVCRTLDVREVRELTNLIGGRLLRLRDTGSGVPRVTRAAGTYHGHIGREPTPGEGRADRLRTPGHPVRQAVPPRGTPDRRRGHELLACDRRVAASPGRRADDRERLPTRRRGGRRGSLGLTRPRLALQPVLDVNDEDGLVYVVDEWIAGTDLASLLRMSGPLSPADARSITLDVAQALASAHTQDLYHLALRPECVMRTDSGGVKILGLGVDAVVSGDTGWNGTARRAGRRAGHPRLPPRSSMRVSPRVAPGTGGVVRPRRPARARPAV